MQITIATDDCEVMGRFHTNEMGVWFDSDGDPVAQDTADFVGEAYIPFGPPLGAAVHFARHQENRSGR